MEGTPASAPPALQPATARFPRLIWIGALLLGVAVTLLQAASGMSTGGAIGWGIGTALPLVLLPWGIWRVGRRSTAAAWAGFAICAFGAISGILQSEPRIVARYERTIAARIERAEDAMLAFGQAGGADLASLHDHADTARQRIGRLAEVTALLEPLAGELASGAELRASLQQADVPEPRVEELVQQHLAAAATKSSRSHVQACLTWTRAVHDLIELADHYRDSWIIEADGALAFEDDAPDLAKANLVAALERAWQAGQSLAGDQPGR